MAPTTPDEWLPVLAKRQDDRFARITLLRDYANGRAPLPEMGENLKASWLAFQKKSRTDYGGLCVGSLADRIRPNGILIGDAPDTPESVQARRIWRDNRMDVQLSDAVDDYLTTSVGYLVVGRGVDGRAVITREAPEQFIAATDPLRPWKARAALKVWRDLDAKMDYALVWASGSRQLYQRSSWNDERRLLQRVQGGWGKVESGLETYEGDPPVVVFERKSGLGLFEPHTDVIDRINLGKLQRLVIAAMQAFRQRALKAQPGTGGLPEKDENGHPIEWDKILAPAPGALWELPEGIDIWESQQTDIRPLLEGEKSDARDFAAVTRTPISVFIPDGANQSAEGAANSTAGQVAQAEQEIARLKPALAVVLVYSLRVEGTDLGESQTVEVSFEPPAYVSLSEKYAAAAQAKAAGEPWKSIARNILGYSPEKIAQAELDRAEEQLSAATLIQAATPPPAPVPQEPVRQRRAPANA